MNPEHKSYSYDSVANFLREEKLKISQAYKKKNQRQHPAFKK